MHVTHIEREDDAFAPCSKAGGTADNERLFAPEYKSYSGAFLCGKKKYCIIVGGFPANMHLHKSAPENPNQKE